MKDKFNYLNLYNYTDDLVYTGLPSVICQSYHILMALLKELGLEISDSKLIEPTNIAIYLGIEIHTVNRTLCIPDEKLKEIQNIRLTHITKNKVTNLYYVPSFILQSVLNQPGIS